MAKNKAVIALIVPMYDPSLKPDQGLPGSQPHPDQGLPGDLPHPEHPIYYPLPPGAPVDPEYGVDVNAPYPDQGLPGSQPKPDQGLPAPQPHPEHPIVLPPGGGNWLPVYIDNTLPGEQPKPDQGLPPFPSHPIVIPPDGTAPPEAGGGKVKWKAIWTPANGWQLVGVVIPSGPVPTPSKKK